MPFRDAYIEVGLRIEKGEFEIPKKLHHTHEGSLGNLCNNEITLRFNRIWKDFEQQHTIIEKKFNSLLEN